MRFLHCEAFVSRLSVMEEECLAAVSVTLKNVNFNDRGRVRCLTGVNREEGGCCVKRMMHTLTAVAQAMQSMAN